HAQPALFGQQRSRAGSGGGDAFLARGGADSCLFCGGLQLRYAPGGNGASRKAWRGVRWVCGGSAGLFPEVDAAIPARRGQRLFFLGAIQTKPRIRSASRFSVFLNSAGGDLALARSVMAPRVPGRPRNNSPTTSAHR